MKFYFVHEGIEYRFTFEHPGLVDVRLKFNHSEMGPTITTAWPHAIVDDKIEVKIDYGDFPFHQEARDYVNKLIKMKAFL